MRLWVLTHNDRAFVALYSTLELAKADVEFYAKREDCTIKWISFGGDKWIGYYLDEDGRYKKCIDNPRWKVWITEKTVR